jgi:uncharacterized membrane protein YqjE
MPAKNPTEARAGTLRSLLGRLTALIQVRAELFSLEAQEQKNALISNLLIALLAFGCLLLALIASLIFITLITPPGLRPLVLGLVALAWLLLSGSALWLLLRRMASQPQPFSLSLTEVRKDIDALLGKD